MLHLPFHSSHSPARHEEDTDLIVGIYDSKYLDTRRLALIPLPLILIPMS